MRGACKYCKEEAEHFVPNLGAYLCSEHFLIYFYKRVRRVLKKARAGKKVLVGVSGGKDSVAALYALSSLREEFGLEIGALHIDLGFAETSKCYETFKRACFETEAKEHFISLKNEYGFSIPDLAGRIKNLCQACGGVRRYLLNKLAWEEGYDYVATGHNLDDMVYFAFNNLITHNLSFLSSLDSVLPSIPEARLVGRIRPLFWLSNVDSITYLKIMGVEYCKLKCPYSKETKQIYLKSLFDEVQLKWPQSKVNFVNSLRRLVRGASFRRKEEGMRLCSRCGYPSLTEVCSFCRLREYFGREG